MSYVHQCIRSMAITDQLFQSFPEGWGYPESIKIFKDLRCNSDQHLFVNKNKCKRPSNRTIDIDLIGKLQICHRLLQQNWFWLIHYLRMSVVKFYLINPKITNIFNFYRRQFNGHLGCTKHHRWMNKPLHVMLKLINVAGS